jgi:hypothetical protein
VAHIGEVRRSPGFDRRGRIEVLKCEKRDDREGSGDPLERNTNMLEPPDESRVRKEDKGEAGERQDNAEPVENPVE